MNFSYTDHVGTGSTISFPFSFVGPSPGYLSVSNIKVYVNDVERPYTLTGTNQVTITPAPANGSKVRIRRVMNKDEPFATFNRGNAFSPDILNKSFLTSLYIYHEFLDGFSESEPYQFKGGVSAVSLAVTSGINMNGSRISNLGLPVASTDAATKGYIDDQTQSAADSAELARQQAIIATEQANRAESYADDFEVSLAGNKAAAIASINSDVTAVDNAANSAIYSIGNDRLAVSNAANLALPNITSDVASVQSVAEYAINYEIPQQIERLGLLYPPIPYEAGLTLNSRVSTYNYNNSNYIWAGPLGTVTSGLFNETGWQLLQGDLQLRNDVTKGSSAIKDIKHLSSVDELRSTVGQYHGQTVYLVSYYGGWAATTRGPVGGGMFTWDSVSTDYDKGPYEARIFKVDGVTVGRWVRAIGGELWDTQAGSLNDLVTDDSPAVQSCIDTLSSLGGGVVRLSQLLALNGVEILTNGITIQGLGRFGTIVRYTGGPSFGTVAAFSVGQSKSGSGPLIPPSGCALRDMTIDGNRNGGAVGSAIRSAVFNGFTISNVHTYDCALNYGFAIIGTGSIPRQDLLVENSSAYRCGADGMDIKAGGERIVIRNFKTGDHLNETSGDSVGIDIRGQYITVDGVFCQNCPEINFRVRVNVGVRQPSDTDWSLTEKAKVNISNVFSVGGRDGFDIASPKDSVVNVYGISANNCSRYGISAGGEGTVNITDSSTTNNLIGLVPSGNINLVNVVIDNNTQDGLNGLSVKTINMTGGSISGNGRYGIQQTSTPSDSKWLFSNVKVSGNLTNYVVNSASADGLVEFINSINSGATSRGVQMNTLSPVRVRFNGGSISGNATNLHTLNSNTKFNNVDGIISRSFGSVSFPVDSTGVKLVQISHGITSGTPDLDRVQLCLARGTATEDYSVDFVRVDGVSSTLFTFRVKVGTASAVSGATAKLNWNVDMGY